MESSIPAVRACAVVYWSCTMSEPAARPRSSWSIKVAPADVWDETIPREMSKDNQLTLIIVASIKQLLGRDVHRTNQDRTEQFARVLETERQARGQFRRSESAGS